MSEPRCLGVIRIGRMHIAIPAAALQEVVPGPLAISALPDAAPFVLGLINLRGTPLPVLDLAHCLHSEQPPQPNAPLFVVVCGPQGRLAVLADEVVKVTQTEAAKFSTLTSHGTHGFFKEVFAEDAQVISVLDVEALLDFPGVRAQIFTRATETASAVKTDESARTLFRIGPLTFAVDLSATAGAMVIPALEGSSLQSQFLRGFCAVNGQQTAVIDLLTLLDLPQADDMIFPDRMMVIESGGVQIAFGISEIIAIEKQTSAQLLALTGSGIAQTTLYQGAVRSPRFGEVLVLAHNAILQHPDITRLATVHAAAATQSATQLTGANERTSFVLYQAGQSTLATPVLELQAILPYPTTLTSLRKGEAPFIGLFHWQKQAVPLIDLGKLLRKPTQKINPQETRVLVVRHGETLRGFLVDRVESLQTAVPVALPWSEPRGGSSTQLPQEVRPPTQMICVPDPTLRRNASVLHLLEVEVDALIH